MKQSIALVKQKKKKHFSLNVTRQHDIYSDYVSILQLTWDNQRKRQELPELPRTGNFKLQNKQRELGCKNR